jgi:hypothetical protein
MGDTTQEDHMDLNQLKSAVALLEALQVGDERAACLDWESAGAGLGLRERRGRGGRLGWEKVAAHCPCPPLEGKPAPVLGLTLRDKDH